jgi:hypothetical protein
MKFDRNFGFPRLDHICFLPKNNLYHACIFPTFVYFLSHYAKLKKVEEEREKELAEKYRDRVNIIEYTCMVNRKHALSLMHPIVLVIELDVEWYSK